MDRNIKFFGYLTVKQFMALYCCYLVLMTLLNIVLYSLATFLVVLLDPYLGELIYIQAPMMHTLVTTFFLGTLFIKAQSFFALYRWRMKSNLNVTRLRLVESYEHYFCYCFVIQLVLLALALTV